MIDLIAAQRHSTNNQAEIEGSSVCGCYHCMQTFAPAEIIAWTGWDAAGAEESQPSNAMTALCPRCGSESVIGDKSGYRITPQFLTLMYEAWFQKTIIYKPRAKP